MCYYFSYFLHGFHLHIYFHIKPPCQPLFLPRRRPGNRAVHEIVTMTDTSNQSEVPVNPQLRPGAVISFRRQRAHLVGVCPSMLVPAFLLKLITSQKSQAVAPGPADLGRHLDLGWCSHFGNGGTPPTHHTLFKCVPPRSSSIVPRT